jgi:uncharacterized membrane protein
MASEARESHPSDRMTTPQPEALPDEPIGSHPPERLKFIQLWRAIALVCTLGLIVLGLCWELWLAPLPGGSGALALKVLPLTLAISGLLKHRMYAFRWLSLLVWLYFTEGVMRGSTDQGLSQALALAETALSLGLFVACAVYVRLRLKVLPPKAKGDQDSANTPSAQHQALSQAHTLPEVPHRQP